MERLAGGISNVGVRWRFIVRACWTVKLCWWEEAVTSRIPAAHIGSIRIMDFSSSIRWTVARRHRFGGSLVDSSVVMTAALSSHLKM